MAKAKKLNEMAYGDLLTHLDEVSEELFNLRFQNATGQLSNSSRIGQVRKDKARALTEERAREIAKAEELEAEAEEVAS